MRYCSLKQLSQWFPFAAGTWSRWERAGRLPGTKREGGRVRIPFIAAMRLMEQRTQLELIEHGAARIRAREQRPPRLRGKTIARQMQEAAR
jgi:predicted site-specific integrase-resolvase